MSLTAVVRSSPVMDAPPAAVIPAYNEAAVIGSVVLGTRRFVEHVLVVDDGSSDETARLAREAGAEVIRLPRNMGKAAAVREGVAAARRHGFQAVVMLDADGQHLPAEIPRVLGPVLNGEADLVIGSRFLEGCSDVPGYRRAGQRTLDLLTALGTGTTLTDTQSGFRALGPRALAHFDFPSDGYGLESGMIAHFVSCDLAILEVPITCRYDVPNSHKKHPVLHGLEIVRALSHAVVVRQRRTLRVIGTPLVVTGSLFGIVPVLMLPAGSGAWTPASVALFGALAVVGAALIAGSGLPPSRTNADPGHAGDVHTASVGSPAGEPSSPVRTGELR